MKKNEKIGIAIVAILIIILVIIIWSGKTANPKIKAEINCEKACHKIKNNSWTFPGAGPIGENVFSIKEDCISACQDKFIK